MAIQRLDLNLLRVFEAVFRQGSVSMAARELGVTASAVSHALGRLRHVLDDELFVPGETGMAPTPRALELAPGIRGGLERIEQTISRRPFAPETSTRAFRISATDYSTSIILAPFVARMVQVAPEVELKVFPYNRLDVVRQLDEGRIDLVIGWFGDIPARMRRAPILSDREAMVVRPGHPLAGRPLTRAEIFDYPMAVVEFTGTEDQGTDGFMDDRGVWRRVWIDRLVMETDPDCDAVGHVAVSLPHYTSVADILESSDMVATLPGRLALRAVAAGRLVMLEMPHPPLVATVEAVWHERGDGDPGLQWLVHAIINAVAAK